MHQKIVTVLFSLDFWMAKSCSSENNVYSQVYRLFLNHRYEEAAKQQQPQQRMLSEMLGYMELV